MSDLMACLIRRIDMSVHAALADYAYAILARHYTDEVTARTPESWDGPWFEMQKEYMQNGWRVLGFGHFSFAVAHPDHPGIAIKLGLKKEDSGAAYAAWARSKQEEFVHVPRILHMRRYKQAYAVVMPEYERYEYFGDSDKDVEYAQVRRVFWGEEVDPNECLTPDLIRCAQEIYKFFDGVASFDLHPGNVMLDSEGRLIITDPVSFTQNEQYD